VQLFAVRVFGGNNYPTLTTVLTTTHMNIGERQRTDDSSNRPK
jgi:hypothetical protein